MTMRYAHLSPGALIDAANVVGQMVTRTKANALNQPLPFQTAS
jgi:hypothetical protein